MAFSKHVNEGVGRGQISSKSCQLIKVKSRLPKFFVNRTSSAVPVRFTINLTIYYIFRHWVNSVSDIYGPDEIEELLEDLNRLEMASFDGIMMFDNEHEPPLDLMRPTSSEMNIMRNDEAVISGCITQPPDDDLEDFDIDGSHVSIRGIRNLSATRNPLHGLKALY